MAALLLCGCNPLMTATLTNLKGAVSGPDELDVTPDQVAAIRYPQIKLSTPSGEGVLAMVRQRGDLQYWVASGKQVLLLRDGLAVRSVGHGYSSRRFIDLYQGYETGVVLNSRFTRQPMETIRILDKEYALLRVDEHIDAPAIGLHATNHYWVNPDNGFILQSEQQLTKQLRVKIVRLTAEREVVR
jgi:hypothetical protein